MSAESSGSNEGVVRWLSKAGLSRYVPRLLEAGVDDEGFKALRLEDCTRFGIDAAADRQKLVKLVRSLNPAPAASPSAPAGGSARGSSGSGEPDGLWPGLSREEAHAGLLDVHALDDEDLLGEAADASLLLSPDSLGGGEEQLPRIRVVVRKRPLNTRERGRREEDVVVVRGPSLTVHEPRTKVDLTRYTECHSFTFDDVLEETASNDQVYALAVEPLVATVFRRGRATCFAYGQTGSGKTHTMQPLPVRTARQMLETLASHAAFSGLRLGLSYFEIYGGRVFDLLSERRKLCIRESGAGEIVVVGLREHPVSDVATVQQLIERGLSARSTGSTGANADSSRSHAILQLTLRRRLRGDSGAPTEEGGPVALGRLHGRFSFIDLAGSERGADTTDNDRQTRLEGAEINKSLLALKECIRALDQDRAQGGAGRHIPFRGSKLTEVLRDSFGGDGRTVMVANISPASGSCEHTLNTLRYADRVKELRRGEESAARVSPERRPVSRSVGVRASLQRPVSRSLPQRPSTAGAAVARSPPLAVAAPPPPSPSLRRSVTSQDALDEEDALLAAAHEELMHTILEEEEVIIAAHRRQIEDTMESVRAEMALLQEVDRPGSTIDEYVSGLAAILAARAASVAELQARLATFQRHLKEEEILSRSVKGAGGPA